MIVDFYRQDIKLFDIETNLITHTDVILGIESVSVEFISITPVNLTPGDYIIVENEKYYIFKAPDYSQNLNGYSYKFVLYHRNYIITHKIYTQKNTYKTNFTQSHNLRGFLELWLWNINTSLNEFGVDNDWIIGDIVDTPYREIQFTSINCLNVLNKLCEVFRLEFELTPGKVINFYNRVDSGYTIDLNDNDNEGNYELIALDNFEDFYTRAYIKGGNKNIPLLYQDENGYLKPTFDYIQDTQFYDQIKETTKIFKDEYPYYVIPIKNKINYNNKLFLIEVENGFKDKLQVDTQIKFLTGVFTNLSFSFTYDEETNLTLINFDGYSEDLINQVNIGDLVTFENYEVPSFVLNDTQKRLNLISNEWFYNQNFPLCRLEVKFPSSFYGQVNSLPIGANTLFTYKGNSYNNLRLIKKDVNLSTNELTLIISNYWDIENLILSRQASQSSIILDGVEKLSELKDVSLTELKPEQVLKWDGFSWTNSEFSLNIAELDNRYAPKNHTHNWSEIQNKPLTDEQFLEILKISTYWKLDSNDNLYTERNVYSTKEVSAYGIGTGGGGGGTGVDTLRDLLDVSLSEDVPAGHLLSFNGTHWVNISQSSIIPDLSGYVTTSVFENHVNDVSKHVSVSDRTNWNAAYNNQHTHENKPIIDQITQTHLDVLALLSIVNGSLRIGANAYSIGELSAYGEGTGGGGGGSSFLSELVDVNVTGVAANDLLTYNGTHWVPVNRASVGTQVSWGSTSNNYSTLNVAGVSKTVALNGHMHSTSEITGLGTLLEGKYDTPTGTTSQYIRGDGSLATFPTLISEAELNTGTANTARLISALRLNTWADNKYHTISDFNLHKTNQQTEKHLTQTQLTGLINLINWWKLDGSGNLYTDLNVYSTKEVSAYGLGTGGGGGGSFAGLSDVNVTGINSTDLITFNGTHFVPIARSSVGTPVSWGTVSGGYSPLTVAGVTRSLAVSGHTHNMSDINMLMLTLEGKQDVLNVATLTELNNGTLTTKRAVSAKNLNDWLTGKGYLTGNQNITLSGDVTGSGATSIATSILNTVVTGKTLTGYSIGSNAAIAATDTILGAFGKVQAQINARPGTVTSVGLTAPTGFSVTGSPITSAGTLTLAFASGYSLPTTAKQNNWDTVYNWYNTVGKYWLLDSTNDALYTTKNVYSQKELSAYGAGSGGSGGGGLIETVYGYASLGGTFNNTNLTDTFNAYTINQLHSRINSLEAGSALTINTTGSGNAVTAITKSGTVITATKGLTFMQTSHAANSITSTNINNWNTAYGWGNHAGLYLPLSGGTISGTIISTQASILPKLQSTQTSGNAILRMISTNNGYDRGFGMSLSGELIFGEWADVSTLSSSWWTVYHSNNLSLSTLGGVPTSRTVTAGTGLSGGGNLTANRTLSLDTTYTDNRYLQRSGGSMTNTNLVSNLNADLFESKHGYDYRGEVDLLRSSDYCSTVYALVNLTTSSESWWMGDFYWTRVNGINPPYMGRVSIQNVYDSTNARGYLEATSSSGIRLCTFTYNGIKYAGIHQYVSSSQIYNAKFFGRGNPTSFIPFKVDYYNNNTSTILNSEVYNSLVIEGSDFIIQPMVVRGGIIASSFLGNATTATTLQTSRTIWGQSFNGSANISGSLSGVTTLTGQSGSIGFIATDNSAASLWLSHSENTLRRYSSATGMTLGTLPYKWANTFTDKVTTGTYNYTSQTGGVTFADGALNGAIWYDGTGTTARIGRVNDVLYVGYRGGTGANGLAIDADGNVSTGKSLTLAGTATAQDASINFSRPSYNYITTPTSGGLSFITNGDATSIVNAMLVLSPNGNVGIGKGFTNNTTAITHALTVNGGIWSSDSVTASNFVSTTTSGFMFTGAKSTAFNAIGVPASGGIMLITNGLSLAAANASIYTAANGNTRIGRNDTEPTQALHVFGNIIATGEITAYVASDKRLKELIKPIDSPLDKITKLNPVSYKWNEEAFKYNSGKTKGLDYGLIAQDVENIIPEAVHGIYEDKYKSIDYIKLIPFLIGAIKELKHKLDKYEKDNFMAG